MKKQILTILVICGTAIAVSAQAKAAPNSYDKLVAFERAQLQTLLEQRATNPSPELNVKLFALGYRDGIALSQADLSVRIARAELHQQFYTQNGDAATAAKVALAITEMREEQAKSQH